MADPSYARRLLNIFKKLLMNNVTTKLPADGRARAKPTDLGSVLGALLRDVARAQDISNRYSAQLSQVYENDALLREFPVPNARLADVELELVFTITGVSEVAGVGEQAEVPVVVNAADGTQAQADGAAGNGEQATPAGVSAGAMPSTSTVVNVSVDGDQLGHAKAGHAASLKCRIQMQNLKWLSLEEDRQATRMAMVGGA